MHGTSTAHTHVAPMSKKFTLCKEWGADTHTDAHFGVCLFIQSTTGEGQGQGQGQICRAGVGPQCHNARGHDKRKMTVAMLKSAHSAPAPAPSAPCTSFCICSTARATTKFFCYLNHDSLSKQRRAPAASLLPTPSPVQRKPQQLPHLFMPGHTARESHRRGNPPASQTTGIFSLFLASCQVAVLFPFVRFLFILPKTLPFSLRERR